MGDTELQQLEKIKTSTGGLNPVQLTRYNQLKTEADANDPVKQLMATQSAATASQNVAQEGKISDFLTRFKTAVGGQETLSDAAARIGGNLGLPQLQSTAQGLIKSVAQIPQVQTSATRGYDVNSNQLARIIGAKQAELAPAAQTAVTQEQAAESNLGTQLGYTVADQNKQLLPLTTEGSMLSDQIAREMTGFNADKQNQLQLIMQQIANGQQLTVAQLQQANDLAKIKAETAAKSADIYKTLSPGETLYNTATGQPEYKAPSAPGSMGTWS